MPFALWLGIEFMTHWLSCVLCVTLVLILYPRKYHFLLCLLPLVFWAIWLILLQSLFLKCLHLFSVSFFVNSEFILTRFCLWQCICMIMCVLYAWQARKNYLRICRAALVLCSYTRGWKVFIVLFNIYVCIYVCVYN